MGGSWSGALEAMKSGRVEGRGSGEKGLGDERVRDGEVKDSIWKRGNGIYVVEEGCTCCAGR